MRRVESNLQLIVPEDRKSITLKVGDVHLGMSTEQLSKIINDLAKARQHMVPEVPEEYGFSGSIEVHPNPKFEVSRDGIDQTVILKMRSPGYGWIAASLQVDFAEDLARTLQKVVDEHRQAERQRSKH